MPQKIKLLHKTERKRLMELSGENLLCLSAFASYKYCLLCKLEVSHHFNINLHFLSYIDLAGVCISCGALPTKRESHSSKLSFLSGIHPSPLLFSLPLHLHPSLSPALPFPFKKVALVLYK